MLQGEKWSRSTGKGVSGPLAPRGHRWTGKGQDGWGRPPGRSKTEVKSSRRSNPGGGGALLDKEACSNMLPRQGTEDRVVLGGVSVRAGAPGLTVRG